MADKLNVSNKTVSKWECGSGNPDIEILIKMAEIFSVTLDELVKNDITIDEKTNKQNKKHFKKKIEEPVVDEVIEPVIDPAIPVEF